MRSFRLVLVALAASACSKAAEPPPNITPTPEVAPAVAAADLPVNAGDCAEARRRAAETPDLVVDQIPAPITQKPAALTKLPASAFRKDGSAEVKVDVLIDTIGKPVMSTFKVVTASSPLLSANVKSVIAKWTFSPAELAGCKVARIYHFAATAPAKKKA